MSLLTLSNAPTATKPTFFVGDIPVYGDAILSPMAGYSDVPYRALCRAYGSSMNYTEFVPVEALLGRRNPMWDRLNKKPDEKPMVFQIFGNKADYFLRASQRIMELDPDIIDINMGCSARRVSGRGAGVGMMLQPELVAETFRLLTTHLPIPITGKIRLGWDDDQINFLEIAKIMEDNGAALVALHGRTKAQRYGHKANWDAIAELKQAVNIPVIGNGDIAAPADIDRMLAYTGCDGVMIGRHAVGNPWIFARRERDTLHFADIAAAMRLHLSEMIAYYGERRGLIQFRKHVKRYFSGIAAKPVTAAMMIAPNRAEFEWLLDEMEAAIPPHESIVDLMVLPDSTWTFLDEVDQK